MFPIRLKELRESAGYSSQQSFADAFGVRQSTVGNWEAGKREPNYETIKRLANFFNVSIDYLLGESEYPARHGDLLSIDRGVVTPGLYSYLVRRLGNDEEIVSFLKDKGLDLGTIKKPTGTPVRIPTETLWLLANSFGDDPNFLYCISDDVDPKMVKNISLPTDFQLIIEIAKGLDTTGLRKLLEYGKDLQSSGKYDAKKGAEAMEQTI